MKQLIDYIKESKDEIKHYVDGILVNKDTDEILLLKRSNYVDLFKGKWGFVGGSVNESDKTTKDALIREIKEETGITLSFNEEYSMKYFGKQEHLGPGNDDKVVSYTEYFIIEMESKPEIKLSKEHTEYKWFDKEMIKENQGKYISDVFHYIQKYYDK